MSWHAGDWGNFAVSLGSAMGTVAASWMAYKAAKSNSQSQEKMDEVKVFDHLLSISQRIFGIIKDNKINDLPSASRNSIAMLICVAKSAIIDSGINQESQIRLRDNFIFMLPSEISISVKSQKVEISSMNDLDRYSDTLLKVSYREARKFFLTE